MAQKIRAKFNVAEVTKFGNGGGTKVTLFPANSPSEENDKLWSKNRYGKFEMHFSNPEIEVEFGEYYVDLIKVED